MIVASGQQGYHFHQYHRAPGTHLVISGRDFAQRSMARA
jgi:hypothetical protein